MKNKNNAYFALCWDLLPKVSRSFALVIKWLPRRVGDAVMISYLLCRIADTIEDSSVSASEKRRMLGGFASSLESGNPELPSDGYPETYRELMLHTDKVFGCYRSFSPSVRELIRERVAEMCTGMAKWCDREIVTLEDYNEYCYFVAGQVGKLLTDLFCAYNHIDDKQKALLNEHAVNFGLALQKVNIIRDIRSDLEAGRCYWPTGLLAKYGVARETLLQSENGSKSTKVLNELIDNTWKYLDSAMAYLMLLPEKQSQLRVFCAIPLFMAVATLAKCHNNTTVLSSNKPVKISHEQVSVIIVQTRTFASSNEYLRKQYNQLRNSVSNSSSQIS